MYKVIKQHSLATFFFFFFFFGGGGGVATFGARYFRDLLEATKF